ncbi:MAG: hypothetical protein QOI01_4853, partial [Mycobacterium sp.]|nr:hypothetical protein [Mycobacterium sp.]
AEALDRSSYCGGHLVFDAHVGSHEVGGMAARAQRIDHGPPTAFIATDAHNGGAICGQPPGDGLAHRLRRAP